MKLRKYSIPQKYMLPQPWNVYYARARSQALFRGAFWAFTPESWYQMWVDSGVMRHKGRKVHQYRMVRMDPIEAYGPHNCIIVSNRMHYRKLIFENTRRCPKSNFQPHHAVNYKRRNTDESQQK